MEIAEATPGKLAPILDKLADVYRAAFTAPPYNETEAEVQQFVNQQVPRHAQYAGFRLCIARQWPDGPVAGFAYGYTGIPGQWWYDTVSAAIGPELTLKWMAHYFELVELAVAPIAQGQGIGGKLHDTLLSGLPHRTALLSAYPEATDALRLYRNREWQVIRERLTFPGADRTPVLMGLELAKKR